MRFRFTQGRNQGNANSLRKHDSNVSGFPRL